MWSDEKWSIYLISLSGLGVNVIKPWFIVGPNDPTSMDSTKASNNNNLIPFQKNL